MIPEARERASGMASYAALSAFGLRRCAPQEPNARAAGSASLPRLKARIEPPRWPLSSPLSQGKRSYKMETKKFIYYKDGDMWIGWLEEYPDYRTQGETLEELEENLRDIYTDLSSDAIPYVHRVGKLRVA